MPTGPPICLGGPVVRPEDAGSGSGVLDGRDVELQLDLVGDQDAAGLECGVEAHAPVTALDRGRPLETDAGVAERVDRRADVLEWDRDRVLDSFDARVSGDGPARTV